MRIVVLIVVIVAVAGFALWGGGVQDRADFRFINRGSVNILDPAQMSYAQDIRLALSLWEGLTTLKPGTLEPAEGVAYCPPKLSDDKRTYLFTLRPDARWSNGDAVTAADFERAWRRAIEPGTSDVYAELVYRYIAGATDYVNWRTAEASLIGLARQLHRGSPIKIESVRTAMLTDFRWSLLADMGGIVLPPPEVGAEDAAWARVLDALRRDDVDWGGLADDLLDAHIAEMDERWSRVGIRVLDDHHLEVRLERPTAFFLDITSFSTYLPVHQSIDLLRGRWHGKPLNEAGLWANDPQWTKPDYHRKGYPGLVSNGAYKLVDWQFKRRMRFEANPYYWNVGQVQSKSIEIEDVEYQNTAFMLYDQGFVDLICELSMEYVPELVEQNAKHLRNDIHTIPAFGTYYYDINCRPYLHDGRKNPLRDARVRRALAMAIDKQQLVDHVERLGNPVANALIPVGQIPGYTSPEGLPYDPDRARRELAEAGYPNGAGLMTIELLYNTGADHEVKAQAIKRMWEQQLGVSCLLVGKETKTFAEDKARGRFMIARSGWFGDYVDPTTFLDLVYSTNTHNMPGFVDAKYDRLLDQAADEPDSARRLAILSEAEGYLMQEQVPLLPLYTYVTVFAWRPNVTGVSLSARLDFPLYCIHVER